MYRIEGVMHAARKDFLIHQSLLLSTTHVLTESLEVWTDLCSVWAVCELLQMLAYSLRSAVHTPLTHQSA